MQLSIINKDTQKMLEERYFYKDPETGKTLEKNPEEMFMRVAKVAAKSEKPELREQWTQTFYELMDNQLVMPNTPTLIGAGYEGKCLSACSVIGRIPDSLNEIYNYVKYNALLTKSGLGVGQDLSDIRPKSEIIKSSGGQSAGVVNWMKLINTVAETTKQGDKARRAANMVGLRFNHPDIFDFIESKRNNSDFTNMNISVVISDDEMIAIKEDKNINLEWNGKTYQTIKARDIFKKLIDNMYNHGDPGVLFLDTMNKNNPFNLQDGQFKDGCPHFIHISNPCFTGDMKLLTTEGYKTFEELCDNECDIINVNGDSSHSKIWCSGKKEVIELSLSNRKKIKCTPNHKFMTIDGNECQAKDLKNKKLMPINRINNQINKRFIQYGFIQGDGQLTRLNSQRHLGLEVNIGEKDTDIFCLFENEQFSKTSDNRRIYLNNFNEDLIKLGFSDKILPDRQFPTTYKIWSIDKKSAFLQGCYSANGSIIKNNRICYKTTCKNFAEEMQETLREDFNISGYITTNKEKTVVFKDKEYVCRKSYDVNISKFDDIQKFLIYINFYQLYKKIQLENLINSRAPKVRSVRKIGVEKVYDFNESHTHWGVVEGCIVHNCGEQNLEAFEYCNLASINVSKLYNQLTNSIDWDKFKEVIINSVRFLDDIIDVNTFPVAQFKEKVLGSRKIGLGLTGYAELLVKMGIKYDSQEHLDFIDILFKFKQDCEIKASSELAQEKGNALFWKDSIWGKKNIPMRNLCRNTQAPTGSISSILNTTAYGIEPFFMVCYKRRIMDSEIYEANELFQGMLHNEINNLKKEQNIMKKCYEEGTVQLDCVPLKLQNIFRCANDISADWHIRIQAQMQKYIDSAISKTVNAPENDKIDDLDNRVISAWEQGVVGMTYYRNNSLQNQTIQIGNTDDKQSHNDKVKLDSVQPIKRKDFGKKTTGTTTKYQTACGSFYLTINRDVEGHLVESFVNTSKNGTCKSTIDGLNRMISLALRSGTKVEEIIDQLKGITCSACTRTTYKGIKKIDGLSCPDIIANALKQEYFEGIQNVNSGKLNTTTYNISKENNLISDDKCPDCGSSMFLTEGCSRCTKCSYTKC